MLCSRRYGSIEAGHEPHPIENSYSTLVTGGLSQIQYTLTVGRLVSARCLGPIFLGWRAPYLISSGRL